jgi:hypothetical protein
MMKTKSTNGTNKRSRIIVYDECTTSHLFRKKYESFRTEPPTSLSLSFGSTTLDNACTDEESRNDYETSHTCLDDDCRDRTMLELVETVKFGSCHENGGLEVKVKTSHSGSLFRLFHQLDDGLESRLLHRLKKSSFIYQIIFRFCFFVGSILYLVLLVHLLMQYYASIRSMQYQFVTGPFHRRFDLAHYNN